MIFLKNFKTTFESQQYLEEFRRAPQKIVLETLWEMDAKWLCLESLKYIYLNHSRKSQDFVLFHWSGTSKCTWVTQRKCNLHPFTEVAQIHFLGWVALNRSKSNDLIIIDMAHKMFLDLERIPKQFFKISQRFPKEFLKKCY